MSLVPSLPPPILSENYFRMTVTEFANLNIRYHSPSDLTPIISLLQIAKPLQEKLSGHPAYYFQNVSDPSKLYILGTWESAEKHTLEREDKGNQEVLQKFLPLLVAENPVNLMHIDVTFEGKGELGFTKGEGMEVVMYAVETKEKSEFEKKVGGGGGSGLEKQDVFGGWRVEREEEDKELFISIRAVDADILESNLESLKSRTPPKDDQHGERFYAKQLII